MTNQRSDKKFLTDGLVSLSISLLFTVIIFFSAIFLSDELSELVREGLLLSVNVILPSIFPFLIITDLTIRFVRFERVGVLRKVFERIFKVNGAALSAYLCGLLCGFPIGARLALTLYENGNISKCECERLMAFANNASPAYAICAVGLGMRNSLTDGIFLYLAIVISSIATGAITGIKKKYYQNNDFILWQKYSFVNSVKSSVSVATSVCGFVTVFAIVSGALKMIIGNDYIFAFVIPFFEIGNAALYLSDLHILGGTSTLALTAFSLSFSGLCVAAQTLSIIDSEKVLSFRRYVPIKLLQGLIAAALIGIFSLFRT